MPSGGAFHVKQIRLCSMHASHLHGGPRVAKANDSAEKSAERRTRALPTAPPSAVGGLTRGVPMVQSRHCPVFECPRLPASRAVGSWGFALCVLRPPALRSRAYVSRSCSLGSRLPLAREQRGCGRLVRAGHAHPSSGRFAPGDPASRNAPRRLSSGPLVLRPSLSCSRPCVRRRAVEKRASRGNGFARQTATAPCPDRSAQWTSMRSHRATGKSGVE